MSRDNHAGVNTILPALSSILNPATPPRTTSPYSIGALNCECFGPQNGTYSQRVPFDSSQVASAPQVPAAAKLTSSLQMSGVRYTGVRWSSPPSALVSRSHNRHSLLDWTVYSLPLKPKTGPVTVM